MKFMTTAHRAHEFKVAAVLVKLAMFSASLNENVVRTTHGHGIPIYSAKK